MDILIRNVPDDVHAELARRAADADQSVAAYVRDILRRHAQQPTIDTWLQQATQLPRPKNRRKAGADWVAEGRAEAADDRGPGR